MKVSGIEVDEDAYRRVFEVIGAPYTPCCKCGGYACPMRTVAGKLYCRKHARVAVLRERFRRVLGEKT